MGEVVRAATILVVERVGQSQLIWTPVLTKPRIFKPPIRIINTFPLHKPLRLVSISRKKRIYHYTRARRKEVNFPFVIPSKLFSYVFWLVLKICLRLLHSMHVVGSPDGNL